MIPITKNIIVTDESGNQYGATYPKRARGLVKNGRARFIADNTICLACPPNNINNFLEDNIMNENIDNITEITEDNSVTANQIIARIDKIIDDKNYIEEAFNLLRPNNGIPLDEYSARALGTVIQAREETNRKILSILETQLNRLTRNDNSMERLRELVEILQRGEQNDKTGNYAASSMEIVRDAANKVFGIE